MRIRQGLEEVVGGRVLVDGKALGELSADELITLWCGKEIDDEGLAAWRAHTSLESGAAREQADWFWEWLEGRTPADRSEVLQFATGNARLRADLGGWRFRIDRQYDPATLQPTNENGLSRPVLLASASTCGGSLLRLPAWESADELADGMEASVMYGGGGFGSC